MATLTKAQMATRVLESLGIIASGQTAATADSTLAEEVVDAAWNRLRKLGLAPYAIGTIPEWAQIPLRDYVAYDLAASFGVVGDRLMDLARRRADAERELNRQVSGYRHNLHIKPEYF